MILFVSSFLLPFFIRGYKRELTEDDMYRHRKQHDSATLGDKLEATWNKEIKTQKDPSLVKAIRRVFGVECILLYILAFALEGAR